MSKNKIFALYYAIGLIASWVFIYLCFAFVLTDFNPFNWGMHSRQGYVFSIFCASVMSFPVSQLIKLEINE